ncbi:MAG TPA: LysR family transcriptional regulator [Labilithrix sp.]|nr:LysR family transcriptional regulator [Labilithrix sp.]
MQSPKSPESMDRARRVAALWNWLPAFRVVAEYASIHKAALVLHVSPSSLSRTIKLIEEVIGTPLFVRTPTGLTLTAFGADLLKGTREALRRVDDALESGGATQLRGTTLVAGAQGSALARLVGVSAAPLAAQGAVRFRLVALSEERVVDELLRGNLDIAIVEGTAVSDLPDELVGEALGDLVFALHAPPSHALATGGPHADLSSEPVVVLTGAEGDVENVVATVASLDVAEILAASRPFLALLPCALAPPSFVRVGVPAARTPIVALTRRALDDRGTSQADVLAASIRERLAPR